MRLTLIQLDQGVGVGDAAVRLDQDQDIHAVPPGTNWSETAFKMLFLERTNILQNNATRERTLADDYYDGGIVK